MGDIAGAIVAITLVMSAVFIPVAFMTGPVGIFYRQFSLTLAIAIVISGVNALTLTPALCAILLRPIDMGRKKDCWVGFLPDSTGVMSRWRGKYQGLLRRVRTGASLRGGCCCCLFWGPGVSVPSCRLVLFRPKTRA